MPSYAVGFEFGDVLEAHETSFKKPLKVGNWSFLRKNLKKFNVHLNFDDKMKP